MAKAVSFTSGCKLYHHFAAVNDIAKIYGDRPEHAVIDMQSVCYAVERGLQGSKAIIKVIFLVRRAEDDIQRHAPALPFEKLDLVLRQVITVRFVLALFVGLVRPVSFFVRE